MPLVKGQFKRLHVRPRYFGARHGGPMSRRLRWGCRYLMTHEVSRVFWTWEFMYLYSIRAFKGHRMRLVAAASPILHVLILPLPQTSSPQPLLRGLALSTLNLPKRTRSRKASTLSSRHAEPKPSASEAPKPLLWMDLHADSILQAACFLFFSEFYQGSIRVLGRGS